jgi:hypothetical protein
MDDDKQIPQQRPIALWFLILILGLLGCLPAMMSPMLGDNPNQPVIPTFVLIVCVGSFPIVCLVSVAVSSRLSYFRRDKAAWSVLALPLINVIIGTLAGVWIKLATP